METQSTSGLVNEVCLQGKVAGRVRDLQGYTKPRTPLSNHNDWERSFVESAGAADVASVATDIFEKLRDSFRYKRKELIFTKSGSTATIQCPDFDVHVTLCQDPDDAERYSLSTDVRSFRTPSILVDPRFLAIFTDYCKQVVFEMHSPIDIEKTIDDIEEVDSLRDALEYDPDCTWFTLSVASIVVRGTPEQMTIALASPGGLDALLLHTRTAMEQLKRDRINFGVLQ